MEEFKVDMTVKKLGENVIFFNQEVATFEGGDVVMNIGNGTIVIQFNDHPEIEKARYAFTVQNMMDALTDYLDIGEKDDSKSN